MEGQIIHPILLAHRFSVVIGCVHACAQRDHYLILALYLRWFLDGSQPSGRVLPDRLTLQASFRRA
jgi:hypothetical protein